MSLKKILEDIRKECETCKECDPSCTGNLFMKYVEFKKINGGTAVNCLK